VHARTGIHEPHQDLAGTRSSRNRRSREERAGCGGLVERHAIDRVIKGRVVHGRWIALVVGRRSGITAAARLSGPNHRLVEARGADGSAHGVVLHRIDFTEEHRNFSVVSNSRRCSSRWIGCARRGSHRRAGDHQDSVQSHGALNRGVRAGFNQVRARPQRGPCQRRRCSRRYFGGERLHAVALGRRRVCGGRVHNRPRDRLRTVSRARGAGRPGAETAAQLAHDGERSRDFVGAKSEIVGEADGKARRARCRYGHGDHHRRPARSCRIQLRAGCGCSRDDGAASIAPHRNGTSCGKSRGGRPGRQINRLLGGRHARSKKENSRSPQCCFDYRFERVESHFCSPCLVGFVNRIFPGIYEHHHHHSAGKCIVGSDLTLIVRVPHKREACLARWRIGDRA